VIKGVGTDIVDLAHFGRVLAGSRPGFLNRLFTEQEIAYCERFKQKVASYAAVFAAKEALLKALGTGLAPGMKWTDVEIVHQASGAPSVRLRGRCAEIAGRGEVHVSLSHSATSAAAFVVIED
jgi:holo-[acyl-carrier protein] synthase